MKVCIIGAGAIGGMIGARLAANTGAEVSALARGETLKALEIAKERIEQHHRRQVPQDLRYTDALGVERSNFYRKMRALGMGPARRHDEDPDA